MTTETKTPAEIAATLSPAQRRAFSGGKLPAGVTWEQFDALDRRLRNHFGCPPVYAPRRTLQALSRMGLLLEMNEYAPIPWGCPSHVGESVASIVYGQDNEMPPEGER